MRKSLLNRLLTFSMILLALLSSSYISFRPVSAQMSGQLTDSFDFSSSIPPGVIINFQEEHMLNALVVINDDTVYDNDETTTMIVSDWLIRIPVNPGVINKYIYSITVEINFGVDDGFALGQTVEYGSERLKPGNWIINIEASNVGLGKVSGDSLDTTPSSTSKFITVSIYRQYDGELWENDYIDISFSVVIYPMSWFVLRHETLQGDTVIDYETVGRNFLVRKIEVSYQYSDTKLPVEYSLVDNEAGLLYLLPGFTYSFSSTTKITSSTNLPLDDIFVYIEKLQSISYDLETDTYKPEVSKTLYDLLDYTDFTITNIARYTDPYTGLVEADIDVSISSDKYSYMIFTVRNRDDYTGYSSAFTIEIDGDKILTYYYGWDNDLNFFIETEIINKSSGVKISDDKYFLPYVSSMYSVIIVLKLGSNANITLVYGDNIITDIINSAVSSASINFSVLEEVDVNNEMSIVGYSSGQIIDISDIIKYRFLPKYMGELNVYDYLTGREIFSTMIDNYDETIYLHDLPPVYASLEFTNATFGIYTYYEEFYGIYNGEIYGGDSFILYENQTVGRVQEGFIENITCYYDVFTGSELCDANPTFSSPMGYYALFGRDYSVILEQVVFALSDNVDNGTGFIAFGFNGYHRAGVFVYLNITDKRFYVDIGQWNGSTIAFSGEKKLLGSLPGKGNYLGVLKLGFNNGVFQASLQLYTANSIVPSTQVAGKPMVSVSVNYKPIYPYKLAIKTTETISISESVIMIDWHISDGSIGFYYSFPGFLVNDEYIIPSMTIMKGDYLVFSTTVVEYIMVSISGQDAIGNTVDISVSDNTADDSSSDAGVIQLIDMPFVYPLNVRLKLSIGKLEFTGFIPETGGALAGRPIETPGGGAQPVGINTSLATPYGILLFAFFVVLLLISLATANTIADSIMYASSISIVVGLMLGVDIYSGIFGFLFAITFSWEVYKRWRTEY